MASCVGKRVLVTGATGFIGRHLVRRLAREGAQVCAAGFSSRADSLKRHSSSVIRLDVRDAEAVREVVDEAAPDVVFHLASVGVTDPGVDPALALDVNAGGALNLLEALRGRDADRIVLVGTSYEYGAREATEGEHCARCLDPFNAYAASKVAAWAFGRTYWRAHGLPVVTARPFQVYGPGQPGHTLVPAAIDAALAGEDFPMTPGEQERDFIYVEDVVGGLLAAAEAPNADGEGLDLGTGTTRSVRHVVERIWQLAGATGEIAPGALPYRPGEVMHLAADADRTARLIGWRARVGLESGLRRTIERQSCEKVGE